MTLLQREFVSFYSTDYFSYCRDSELSKLYCLKFKMISSSSSSVKTKYLVFFWKKTMHLINLILLKILVLCVFFCEFSAVT